MTEVLDSNGNPIRVGDRVYDEHCIPGGWVSAISDPDGDTDSYGIVVGINPVVTVDELDGTTSHYSTRWNATGPWDDHRDDYTCDDLAVQVDEHGQGVNLTAVERLERYAAENVDHDSTDHDWESCGVCVAQAVKDEILAPGSVPFGAEPDGQRVEGGRSVPTDR